MFATNALCLLIITFILIYLWVVSTPSNEFEWVVAIVATLGAFISWRMIIIELLGK
jgi:hypothetical protein